MSFLWPYAWIFSLLAIPIVVFYLIRSLPRRRPVSTLLFWDQIQPRLRSSPLWRKLRRLLSLLLQLLFLFLLIFLLARPLLPWQDTEPATVVYVVDTSASMAASDGGSLSIERARAVLRDRIVHLRATDEALIIAAGTSPEVLQRWTPNRKLLLDSMEKLAPEAGDSDLSSALILATDLARQRENGRVVLISDGVVSGRLPKTEFGDLEIIAITPPESTNRGLASFSARRSRLAPQTILIRARLVQSQNTSPAEEEEARLELSINDRLTDVLPLQFDDEGQIDKTWRIPAEGEARIKARIVSPNPDSFQADDTAALIVDPVETLTVHLVSPPNPFLEAVLSSLDLVNAARIPPDSLPTDPGEGLYLFHQATPPEEFRPSAMVLIQPASSGLWGERLPGTSAESLVTEWDREHDLLRHVDLDQVIFPAFGRYAPPASAESLALSFEDPVIFGEWEGDRRWLATAFGLEESDLVYRTVFPILIGNIARSLSHSSRIAVTDLPGETESRLRAVPEHLVQGEEAMSQTPSDPGVLPSLPLRNWLLLIVLFWTILEWRLYHRKVTE